MKPIAVRLSNVFAWINFALGLCVCSALLYFSVIGLISRDNAPLIHDRNNNEIVTKLGSAGVHDQQDMPIRELADIEALMWLLRDKDEKERAFAEAELPDCFKKYPSMKDPSYNFDRGDATEVICWTNLDRSKQAPLTFSFTPEQALVAWNDIALHKKEQDVRNKKRSAWAYAMAGIANSLLFAVLYIICATLSYIFFGSPRFFPWKSFGD